MTLHWWMHWFWVTAQIVVSLTSPTSESPTSVSPGNPTQQQATTRMQYGTTETLARLQQSYRIAKAIGIQPTTDDSVESLRQSVTTDSQPAPQPRNLQQQWGRIGTTATPDLERMRTTPSPSDNRTSQYPENKTSTQMGRIPGKKETKITWIHAFSKPPRLKTSSTTPTSSEPSTNEELTVMPLQEFPDPNAIRRELHLQLDNDSLVSQESVEPRVVATVASILEAGLVDSTRLGRARGTFTSEFQRDQLSREERKKEETIKETADTGASVTEIATITGSCLAIIILISTLGSLGFIMYRRRYLNPPQTLNSDKCSNPDSSGYIDDSTIRDNSEEMYSLDNDSFLNSLEAMTIQNYWTDSVKHTKL